MRSKGTWCLTASLQYLYPMLSSYGQSWWFNGTHAALFGKSSPTAACRAAWLPGCAFAPSYFSSCPATISIPCASWCRAKLPPPSCPGSLPKGARAWVWEGGMGMTLLSMDPAQPYSLLSIRLQWPCVGGASCCVSCGVKHGQPWEQTKAF